MCKYCEKDDFEEGYCKYFNEEGGFSKDFVLDDETFRIELEMKSDGILVIEFYSMDHDDDLVITKEVKIKYCPWCGRKFNEES